MPSSYLQYSWLTSAIIIYDLTTQVKRKNLAPHFEAVAAKLALPYAPVAEQALQLHPNSALGQVFLDGFYLEIVFKGCLNAVYCCLGS